MNVILLLSGEKLGSRWAPGKVEIREGENFGCAVELVYSHQAAGAPTTAADNNRSKSTDFLCKPCSRSRLFPDAVRESTCSKSPSDRPLFRCNLVRSSRNSWAD